MSYFGIPIRNGLPVGLGSIIPQLSGGRSAPSLSLNFLSGSLDSRVTFTRASTGTYFDSAGVLQTAAIDAPRFEYNPSTLAAQGLLIEESRSNLALYSEQFDNVSWTKNASSITPDVITAPDGALTADRLVENTATATHSISRTFSVTSGTAVTVSVFVKSTERFAVLGLSPNATFGGTTTAGFFNISNGTVQGTSGTVTARIVAAGSGWYRCSITSTPTATGTANAVIGLSANGTAQSYTGDGTSGLHFWGAQVEAGAFPTSYIPTTTAAATRAADVASINTLSPWFNSTEGTLFAQFDSVASGTRTVTAINDGTSNESIQLRTVATDPFFTVTDGGVDQANIDAGTVASYTTYKFAGAYKINDFAACIAGGTVQTDASGTLPAVTQLLLGNSASANYLNGRLQRITYYPRRLANSELQALTV